MEVKDCCSCIVLKLISGRFFLTIFLRGVDERVFSMTDEVDNNWVLSIFERNLVSLYENKLF